MLKIMTTGVEDFIDGSANIKALIIGGPGAGKTRSSSYWPKPIFLDCENGRGSLADRKMPYVAVRDSKDMLDALEYLKGLERTPKASRQFQTVVVDTADSFQRLVKDEWVQKTQAGSFSGYDAWGYLDTKMQLLFTRLLNLDYNVIVAVHYKDKTFKDPDDNVIREHTLQLQGAISDQIFNDFGLVGWLGTYWQAGENGRVQKRGLTFEATPDKPFLKDRFNVTPKWMEITFTDNDYRQLFEAFFNNPEFEAIAEAEEVGTIPDSNGRAPASGVSAPAEGGPLPPRVPVEVPLEKKLKDELMAIAKGLGLSVRGNMLKDELITAIKAKQDEQAATTTDMDQMVSDVKEVGTPPIPPVQDPPNGDAAGVTPQDPAASSSQKVEDPTELQSVLGFSGHRESSTPSSPAAPAADAQAASSEPSESTATSSADEASQAPPMTVEEAAKALGGEVISQELADVPVAPPPLAPVVPPGPETCADCSKSLKDEWSDPTKRDYIRLSYVKHRRYLCSACSALATK